MEDKKEYHILSLSGGKDSTALAFFMKDNMSEIFKNLKLVFFDTECDLSETYEYLNKIEMYLNKKIEYVKPELSFEQLYQIYKFIPSIQYRWCTTGMKTNPFRKYMNKLINEYNAQKIHLYVGIRSDEPTRIENYQKQHIETDDGILKTHYPLAEHGLIKQDVFDILTNSGIGFPEYYEWRSRSGCYFCFFQKKIEWINLLERHPKLFEKALYFEKIGGKNFTWCQDMSLEELKKPENIERIKNKYLQKNNKNIELRNNLIKLME